jgi:hypothetical protein
MTNEVTNRAAGALAALGNLKSGLANVQAAIPVAGGEPILRMGRDGIWLYGQDNIEVEDGSEWAANPLSLKHGYICWKKIPEGSKEKPEKLGEVLVSMYDAKPVKTSLPDYGHPWAEQTSITFKCLNGTDEGTQVDYKPSSVGGSNAMAELISEIMAQLDKDPAHPVPVIALESDSYMHPQYKKTYVPILKIVRWISMDGVAAEDVEQAAGQQEQVEEPKTPPSGQATRRGRAAPATTEEQTRAATDEEKAAIAAAQQDNQPAASGEVRRRRR